MQFLNKLHNPNGGYALLRCFLGAMLILHGISKLMNGTAGVEGMLAKAGLPAFLSYGVYVGEVLAPALLLAGFLVVPAALLVVINMVFAIFLAHSHQIMLLNEKTGGWQIELQMFFLVTALVVAMQAPKCKSST